MKRKAEKISDKQLIALDTISRGNPFGIPTPHEWCESVADRGGYLFRMSLIERRLFSEHYRGERRVYWYGYKITESGIAVLKREEDRLDEIKAAIIASRRRAK